MFKYSNTLSDSIGIAFFNKNFTKSSHIYHVNNNQDNIVEVSKNRESVKEFLELKKLSILKQIHSDIVINIDNSLIDSPLVRIDGDAQVTSSPKIGLGILSADCVPVLLFDHVKKIIGAAHSGWRGTLNNIVSNTIKHMEHMGADKENISALIGPTIHQRSYEVGEDFKESFLAKDPSSKKFFVDSKEDVFYKFDLPGYVRHQLSDLSIQNIDQIHHNTYEMENEYSSHRRSRLSGETYQGSLLSVIYLK